MVDPAKTALSAMRAFGCRLATTAHNLANMNTEGFEADRVVMKTASPAGVTAEVHRSHRSEIMSDTGQGSGSREASNVDVGREMGTVVTAGQGYKANLRTLQTWEEMTRSVIDLLA